MMLVNKLTIGGKLEATPYTAETLLQADYDFRAGDVKYNFEIAEYKRAYATGNLSKYTSIMGKQTASVSFYMDLASMSSIFAPGPHSKFFQACGAAPTVFGSTGINWKPSSTYTQKPMTIEIVEREEGASPVQLVVKLAGCMGNCKIVLAEVGQPVRLEFEFKGRLVSIADRAFGSMITPSFTATNTPARVLSSTLTFNSVAQQCDKVTLDFGNDVQAIVDPSNSTGIMGYQIVAREATLTVDPYMRSLASEAWYTQWLAMTTAAFSMSIGTDLTLSAPAAQYIAANAGDRNQKRTLEKTFLLTGTADDEWKLLQGAEA